jgi:5'-AMP-activated protein kinase, catalytic alpha subunit
VRHPNIIQLYEIIETPKQLFLVMEYVSEGELFELILKKKRLKEAEACEFLRQLLNGVEYLH